MRSKKSRTINPRELSSEVNRSFDLIRPANGKDVILLFGNTGAGKSTLINYLMGAHYQLVVKQRYRGMNVLPTDYSKMELERMPEDDGLQVYAPEGKSNTRSETNYAQAYCSLKAESKYKDVTFVDIAGTNESRKGVKRLVSEMSPLVAVNASKNVQSVIVLMTFSDLANSKGKNFKDVIESMLTLIPNINELADADTPPFLLGITHLTRYQVDEIEEKIDDLIGHYIEELEDSDADTPEYVFAEKALSFLHLFKNHPESLVPITKGNLTGNNLREQLHQDFFSKLDAPISRNEFNLGENNKWLTQIRQEVKEKSESISRHITEFDCLSVELESVNRELERNREIAGFRSFSAGNLSGIRSRINSRLDRNAEQIQDVLGEIDRVQEYILLHDTSELVDLLRENYKTPKWKSNLWYGAAVGSSLVGLGLELVTARLEVDKKRARKLARAPLNAFAKICYDEKAFIYSGEYKPVTASLTSPNGKVASPKARELDSGIASGLLTGQAYSSCDAEFVVQTEERIYYKNELLIKRARLKRLEQKLARLNKEKDMSNFCLEKIDAELLKLSMRPLDGESNESCKDSSIWGELLGVLVRQNVELEKAKSEYEARLEKATMLLKSDHDWVDAIWAVAQVVHFSKDSEVVDVVHDYDVALKLEDRSKNYYSDEEKNSAETEDQADASVEEIAPSTIDQENNHENSMKL